MMLLSEFDYHLPRDLIAQEPLPEREQARLMVLDRSYGELRHAVFRDVVEYLSPGDVLVLNDTKVIRARFFGKRVGTGGKVEVLLIEPLEGERVKEWEAGGFPPGAIWLAYTRSGGKLRPGEKIAVPEGGFSFVLLERRGEEGDVVAFDRDVEDPFGVMDLCGHVPLPPYIERGRDGTDSEKDRDFYQTVYARVPGAVAAPTAGMHFSRELLEEIKDGGVEVLYVTLHVGPGTFRPVKSERIEEHRMHSERYEVSPATLGRLLEARKRGNSVVAVGTTVVRTLETVAAAGCGKNALRGRTDIFIRPPFRFRLTDALVTNFHLPKSTLLMLVSAFAGRESALAAYEEAKREKYRFFSYGDAMLII